MYITQNQNKNNISEKRSVGFSDTIILYYSMSYTILKKMSVF